MKLGIESPKQKDAWRKIESIGENPDNLNTIDEFPDLAIGMQHLCWAWSSACSSSFPSSFSFHLPVGFLQGTLKAVFLQLAAAESLLAIELFPTGVTFSINPVSVFFHENINPKYNSLNVSTNFPPQNVARQKSFKFIVKIRALLKQPWTNCLLKLCLSNKDSGF